MIFEINQVIFKEIQSSSLKNAYIVDWINRFHGLTKNTRLFLK